MNFRTEINIEKHNPQINYSSKIFLAGSCFSDNIGNKFSYYKFQVLSNPFGVIFNPVSIKKLIVRSLNEDFFTEKDFAFYNDKWQCLDLHSQLSGLDLKNTINNANNKLVQTKNFILSASHIILTLGTSWVYRFNKTDKIVANCHKIKQTEFTKELLTAKTVENTVSEIIDTIKKVNHRATFILTISPVRHLKDGFFENNVSKAHLFQAVYKIVLKKSPVFYFPAFEILSDDLRNYRFYTDDMLHPNQLAINYIWNKFKNSWVNEQAFPVMKKVESIQKRLKHKPFNPDSKEHLEFLEKLKKDQNKLKTVIKW